ncbi:hypothetical protein ACFQO4_18330 [Saliphagus sp. GCM10025334]
MGNKSSLALGDEWPEHYRGFQLQISPNGSVWWQLYNGTDRLQLSPEPTDIVDRLLEQKRLGGRIHITENGDVLTRLEDADSGEYKNIYIGEFDLDGELVPEDAPEYSIPIRPTDLEEGDLWPSVYDGARYSFVGNRAWWQNGATNRRHRVEGGLPQRILQPIKQYKPEGGSFRITPWGDVITLVPSHPAPGTVREQFSDIPRVVQNIIKLRKERGVEMLPIYVGNIGDYTIEVNEPRSLTDELSAEERESLSSWASGLGQTSSTSSKEHKTTPTESTKPNSDTNQKDDSSESDESGSDAPEFFDDPVDWIREDIESKE